MFYDVPSVSNVVLGGDRHCSLNSRIVEMTDAHWALRSRK
jgi:hypothetical protein